MFLKYVLFCLFHFTITILVLRSLNFILPSYVTRYYFQAADLLLCAVVAKFTIGYSRKFIFTEKIQPEGKAVLITGCARGIGKHLAKHLDSKGFVVFASCRNSNSPGVDDLRKSCSNRLKILELDVTKDESVEKALQFVKANLGTSELWSVINNGGIQKGFVTELTSIQDCKDTIEVNAIGQVRVTKAFLPLLRKSRGRVINMSSMAGRSALPNCGPYTMSKFASCGFSENLRIELDAWGVRVISIEPEIFETDMSKGSNLLMRFNDSFASAPKEVQKDYGEEFLKKFQYIVRTAFPPSPQIQKVLDDIECAVSLKNPCAVYTPCRSIFLTLVFKFYQACAPECQVFMTNFYFRIWGLPKPEMANKF